ncbi:hypothetical protein ABER75_01205 [Niallia taxi]|nr:hypothetical protein [Niallia taxi]MCM3216558.1 hypothetical protein [Niallia taxi]MDK8640072.1 hypothetical protein [Niallia taxi]MED4038964.1 hypothetical protein [Niallia taxi]MED4054040.1 hypothetical protein [Niallia taxi]MED4118439.1 hypothetical protein [Niallia taxi]
MDEILGHLHKYMLLVTDGFIFEREFGCIRHILYNYACNNLIGRED